MGKHVKRTPPQPLRAAAELTDADRSELSDLSVGTGDFNRILTSCMNFTVSSGWTVKKRDAKYDILWESKPSENSNKQAMRFTANVPNCNTGSLEAILLDDKDFEDDPEVSYMYKYDRLLLENHVDKFVAANVSVQRTNYRSPLVFIAPRQMMSYVTLGALLTPAQQKALGLRPVGLSHESADAARTDNLMAFTQCSIDYTGSEWTLHKGHERGHAYYYSVLGQEEPDGSMTVTVTIDMDPAGKLPAKVVDMASEEQHKKVQIIIDLLKEKGPQPHICSVYENTRDFKCLRDL
ncbi:hypothetical protein NESM_000513600 [Novymonas esmeraldas]|uniref:Uncharacterized protein n=1 Tax=Novymonas esmeraldas TaxID=1808958 RepID=A0AAW0EQ49_9TRYP